jgi:signal transduction histidine kinase
VDLQAAVRLVLAEKEEDIREAGAELRLDLPATGPQVLADFHGLSQVLRNLVENALKYSAAATPPVIEIGCRREGESCLLWITDNGIGFDMSYHDRIFEIFRRLHTYDEFPGSGVGLALVKKAMDRMGGKVWAESAPDQGATFFLQLRVAAQ